MNYKSPITPIMEIAEQELVKETDSLILKGILKTGVTVDKDELEKALQYDRDQYEKGYNDGVMSSKWISIHDRLPKIGEDVLACYDIGNMAVLWLDHYDDSDVYWWVDDHGERYLFSNSCVIAWMPLPEPYKEEE